MTWCGQNLTFGCEDTMFWIWIWIIYPQISQIKVKRQHT